MNILSDVGTENTCTPDRLEALIKSSQSPPFVPSRIRKSKFLYERLRSQCFVKRSAVLFFVSSLRFVLRLSSVQVLCNLAGVVLELLRLDEICVSIRSFLVHVIHDLALPSWLCRPIVVIGDGSASHQLHVRSLPLHGDCGVWSLRSCVSLAHVHISTSRAISGSRISISLSLSELVLF